MSTRSTALTGIRIAGTGLGLPDNVVTNDELAKTVDTSDEWISQRTGIRQRYVANNGTTMRSMAAMATKKALEQAGLRPSDLDMLLCATMTPEMCCPCTAAQIVADIGAVPAGASDISAACSGFVYGLNMASSLVATGHYRHIAVVGAEQMSRILDWKDRRTCVLFGDGAGAAIVSASDNEAQGCLYQSMSSDGTGGRSLYCPRDESQIPTDDEVFSGTFNTLQMNGREVYKFAVSTLQRTIEKSLDACDLKASDLAMVVAHQSNQRILESARERLGLSQDKLYINIDRFANTSAASVPICLHELLDAGRLKEGDLVLFVGLGGGLTWASSLWKL